MLRATGLLALSGACVGYGVSASAADAPPRSALAGKLPFRVCLNTSTISGYKLPVERQIALCTEAGFDGIELWTRDVEAFLGRGGSLEDICKQLRDSNLSLENMIGFSSWFADDPAEREKGLRQMRHDMEMTAHLGGKFIAAPAQGVKRFDAARLPEYAERYRAVLRLGDETGVTPILELWGAGALSRLSDAMAMAIGAAHPNATLLLDFYHLYRGGNSFEGLRLVNGGMLPVFHINDYPASPVREALRDSDRVFPGDGICPFNKLLPLLRSTGFRGGLSVELFNKGYWETMDVRTLLRTSYEKTVQVIRNSI